MLSTVISWALYYSEILLKFSHVIINWAPSKKWNQTSSVWHTWKVFPYNLRTKRERDNCKVPYKENHNGARKFNLVSVERSVCCNKTINKKRKLSEYTCVCIFLECRCGTWNWSKANIIMIIMWKTLCVAIYLIIVIRWSVLGRECPMENWFMIASSDLFSIQLNYRRYTSFI